MDGALATTKARHYPALHFSRFPTRLAVELSLLTIVRASELRSALMNQFDFERVLWWISAQRKDYRRFFNSLSGMKMKEKHHAPLNCQI